METRTIQQIRKGDWPTGEYPFYTYVFRAAKDVLYVGMSEDVLWRVQSHLESSSSALLRAALELNNHNSWCLDLYSAEDIALLPRYSSELAELSRNRSLWWAIDTIGRKRRGKFEKTLIYSLSPAFNINGRKKDYRLAADVAKRYLPTIDEADLQRIGVTETSIWGPELPLFDE